jgi:hypothetical protein
MDARVKPAHDNREGGSLALSSNEYPRSSLPGLTRQSIAQETL